MLWQVAVEMETTIRAVEAFLDQICQEEYSYLLSIILRLVVLSWVLSVILGSIQFVHAFFHKVKALGTWLWFLLVVGGRLAASLSRWCGLV